jgi:hypothetical protein
MQGNGNGMCLHMYARDGDTSYSHLRATWGYAFS